MDARQRAAHRLSWAALVASVGLVLLSYGLAAGPAPELACQWPVAREGRRSERASETEWTTVVRCAKGPGVEPCLRGPARLLFGQRLDLNHADTGSLDVLPGIGPSRAEAIARFRLEHEFHELSDLEAVPGIGPRTLSGLEPWVEVVSSVRATETSVACRLNTEAVSMRRPDRPTGDPE